MQTLTKAALPVQGTYESWYIPAAGHENRDIVAKAYESAIQRLKDEISISGNVPVPLDNRSSLQEIKNVVEAAKRKYEDASKEHTGARKMLESLSIRVLHYSKIFDTLGQHHAEYVALVWGAMKLVLMGIINRANLVQKISQALITIADALPRAELNAKLYKTSAMEAVLSRLFTHIISFFCLCVRWYNRSSVGRLWSSLTTPFELDYQELVDQIRSCSLEIEERAAAAARAESRDFHSEARTLLKLSNSQSTQLLERQANFEVQMLQLLQNVTASRTITERISSDVQVIGQGVYRLEFSQVLKFFKPKVLPQTAFLKAQAFAHRSAAPRLPTHESFRIQRTLQDWASRDSSSLLVVKVGARAQNEAKELAVDVVRHLRSKAQSVFWNISLAHEIECAESMEGLLKSVIFQALQQSGRLFNDFAEQLNLSKINSHHTEHEWADLICLLFSRIPEAFIVLEMGGLHKMYQHDPEWAQRFFALFQHIINHTDLMRGRLKILLMMRYEAADLTLDPSESDSLLVASLQPPAPVPPRLRHTARRSGLDTKGWKLQKPKA